MKNIEMFKEIAQYLNDDVSYENINFIQEAKMNKRFLLTFAGQFSAGKSKLINNILGRDLLPVHITETTQVATFIKYGDCEKVILYFKDNSLEEVSTDYVKELWEGKNDELLGDKKEIEYIEVAINCPILKSGLVIADTPGINTIIKKHETITKNILRSSEAIAYVMSKSITNVDMVFMNEIINSGLKLMCVRTYMDSIKEAEENIDETVAKDIQAIRELGDNSIINIYHISNEADNKWFSNISNIKDYIGNELAVSIDKELEESCDLRLVKIGESLLGKLNEKKKNLDMMVEGNREEADRKKKELENLINKLQTRLEDKKINYDRDVKEARLSARREMAEVKEYLERSFRGKIEDTTYSEGVEKELLTIVYKELSSSSKKLQEAYVNQFNEFIEDKHNDLVNQLEEDIKILNFEDSIPSSVEELALTVEDENIEVDVIKRELVDLANGLEEMEQSLLTCGDSSREYEAQYNAMCEMVRSIEDDMANLGKYECRLVESEDESIQPSQVLKWIGSGLDWASCLLPEKAIVAMAGKVGKYSAVAGKVVQKIGKADSVKDTLFAIKNISEKTRVTKKRTKKVLQTVDKIKGVSEKAGILDLLTFEYWCEKAGKAFDKPIKMEIDKEYEKEFNENRAMLDRQYAKAKEAEINKLQALGLIRNEEEKIKKMREIEERRNRELVDELKEKEKEIRISARNKAFKNVKTQYICLFNESFSELSDVIVKRCDGYLEVPLNQYLEKCTANITYEIKKQIDMNQELINKFDSLEVNELKSERSKCIKYIEFLDGEVNG